VSGISELVSWRVSEATPPAPGHAVGPTVTRASLQADLRAAGERAQRLNNRVRQLEMRLSETLGEKAWKESGLDVPADIDNLNHTISHLCQRRLTSATTLNQL